jgi:hypothetical protein
MGTVSRWVSEQSGIVLLCELRHSGSPSRMSLADTGDEGRGRKALLLQLLMLRSARAGQCMQVFDRPTCKKCIEMQMPCFVRVVSTLASKLMVSKG